MSVRDGKQKPKWRGCGVVVKSLMDVGVYVRSQGGKEAETSVEISLAIPRLERAMTVGERQTSQAAEMVKMAVVKTWLTIGAVRVL